MASSICKSFESNAWRSDLCSHCFQSKEEHDTSHVMTSSDPKTTSHLSTPTATNGQTTGLGSRYQSVLNHSRSSYRTTSAAAIATTTSTVKSSAVTCAPPSVKAILKTKSHRHGNNSSSTKSVNFQLNDDGDAQVIGYGGHECFESDDDETDDRSSNQDDQDDEDDTPFTEEERMIHSQTQKNTSFNSVSRNLLASEVATFKNHGTSSTSSSAPLVTIRPFGQSSAPGSGTPARMKINSGQSDCPKINLVSPMRNGQILTSVTNQTVVNNQEEIKNRDNAFKMKMADDDVTKPSPEPITSFSNPVPIEIQPPPPPPPPSPPPESSVNNKLVKEEPPRNSIVNAKAAALQSSKVASGRMSTETEDSSDGTSPKSLSTNRPITLTRKPPVWREKPRIPIKPQSVTTPAAMLVVEAIPSALYPSAASRDAKETPKSMADGPSAGQINVRFVHLSSGDSSGGDSPIPLPPLMPPPVTTTPPSPLSPAIVKELSALERLDLLESCVVAPSIDHSSLPLDFKNPEAKVPAASSPSPPPLEINNNPVHKIDLVELKEPKMENETSSDVVETKDEKQESTNAGEMAAAAMQSGNNSTRVLTRSAFEALRANLAGTLELSRVYQAQQQRSPSANVTKRQAPPTPLSRAEPEESPPDQAELPSIPPTPPPFPSNLSSSPTPSSAGIAIHPDGDSTEPAGINSPQPAGHCRKKADSKMTSGSQRSVSVSPRYRNSFICTSPEGSLSLANDDDLDSIANPRSVSLTRVERSDSRCTSTKPPSIRQILRERATQFLQLAEGSGGGGGGSGGGGGKSVPESGRLSRSDRFAAETVSAKKTKNRFSLRKFLGLKKESGWDETAEPVVPKIRPEIVHPIDFHPVGQVEVVQGKMDAQTITSLDHVMSSTPAHDSMSSTDSGRHSSLDLHRSDSSAAGGVHSDCPSPANSHQSSGYQHNGSIKGRPKPPPPPRLNSLEQQLSSASTTPTNRPTRPPPPKSGETLHDSMDISASRLSPSPLMMKQNPTEYANLGDIRSAITPKKPERSASMKARERSMAAIGSSSKQDGLHYDCVSIQQQQPAKPTADEDGYIIPMRSMKSSPSFSSSSSAASSSHRFSLSSFQPTSSSPASDSPPKRPSRLGGRQSRQDLHVKLEDHYGTVTGANFQALVQLLEQATTKRPLAAHFHELRRIESRNLKWDLFGDHRLLLRTSSVTVVQSSWQNHDLLLSVSNDDDASHQMAADNKTPFAQPAVVHFTGAVPAPLQPAAGIKAGIEVFPPGQVAMLKQLPHLLAMELDGELERVQHSLSVFLQICRALEWLVQQKRVGHRLNDEEIVFYREHSQDAYRLLWLPQEMSQSAGLLVKETLANSLRLLAPLLSTQLADKLSSLIQQQPSQSLDKLCQYVEFAMFGPAVDRLDDADPMDTFQRWLDVERASALNELIRTQGLWRVKLSIVEEFRLTFLISTSPHHLLDISQM